MELWIRSQNRMVLTKCDRPIYVAKNPSYVTIINIDLKNSSKEEKYNIYVGNDLVGMYSTQKRALDILNEISSKIKNQFIVKPNPILKHSDIDREKRRLENNYNGDFIFQSPTVELQPINPNVIYYEMPER